MGLSYKKAILLAEIEAVPGVAETLVVADGGLVITELSYSPDISILKRNAITQDFGQLASVSGTFAGRVEFATELKGSGTNDVPPLLSDILQMCGFSETINAAASVVYALASTGLKNGTLAVDIQEVDGSDGPRFSIFGAMGNLVISGNVGEIAQVRATLTGVYADAVDVSPLAPAFETIIPPVFRDATFTIGGVPLKVRSFSLDLGNRIVLIPDINAPNGFAYATYVDREPALSFEAELTDVATHDFMGLIKANTQSALVIQTPVVAGNTIQIDATNLQYTGLSLNNVDNVPIAAVQCQINKGGAAEVTITQT